MTPKPASAGVHSIIPTKTGEIHRYDLRVRLGPEDGLPLRSERPAVLLIYETKDGGSLALRGVEDSR